MNVQYYRNRQWFDTQPVISPTSGMIRLQWDNSSEAQETNAVRIKAIDILGHEHYSNEVLTTSVFFINLCNLTAVNSLFEDLKLLKLQVRSDQDTQYAQWTDLFVDDSSPIPVGTFSISGALPNLQTGLTYKFRMVGIGVSGKYYESNAEYPPADCQDEELPSISFKLSLEVDYNDTDCGHISDGIATLRAHISGYQNNILFKTLSYYLQKPEGDQLLRIRWRTLFVR